MSADKIIVPPVEYKPRIVCAALRGKRSGRVVIGARHFDPMMRLSVDFIGWDVDNWKEADQGFIDQRGKFYDRKEAYKIASENGQIVNTLPGAAEGLLFSEHLY